MSIPVYIQKEWKKSDFLLNSYLNHIETGIDNLGKYYYKPYGWQERKNWRGGMSFSYKDVNRWLDNIRIIKERLDNESGLLYPSDDLYPSDNLLPH